MYGLFDIGGTKTRVAVSPDGQAFSDPVIFETPKEYEKGLSQIVTTFRKLTDNPLTAIAGGVPGVRRSDGRLGMIPNLPKWDGVSFANDLGEACQTKVLLENDAALVGLGEAHAGAGKGAEILAYLTISTGVGGARIVKGHIDVNHFGFEPGHQIIDIDGNACTSCEKGGQLENYVSGDSLFHRFGQKPTEITDSAVWEDLARYLAAGLANTILHWSPDRVVLGGPMIVGDPAIPFDLIKTHLQSMLTIFPELPEIRKAELMDMGGLHGALVLLQKGSERN